MKLFLSLFILLQLSVANVAFAQRCEAIFQSTPFQTKIFDFSQARYKKAALRIIMDGSLNVSRTKAAGRRFMAPAEVKDAEVAGIAEKNFHETVTYMLENFQHLEINFNTAVLFNRMLTKDLVPEEVRGKYDFREYPAYAHQINANIGKHPRDFYLKWLDSPQAKELFHSDPTAFAEVLHNTIASLDSFPDGNGRLSRLFADLALIKSGLAPAYYTSMKDYFDRGNPRSDVSRDVRKSYFKDILERGQDALEQMIMDITKLVSVRQTA